METELVKITPSEKTKLYLNKKLSEIEKKVKKNKEEEINNSNDRDHISSWVDDRKYFDKQYGISGTSSDVTIYYVGHNEWSFD